jgi:Flp pilus assembly protein TadD
LQNEKILSSSPGYSPPRAEGVQAQAQRLYARGVTWQQQGRLREAIAAWRDALARDPRHVDARYNLAVGLGALGDAVGAESNYAELLCYRPAYPQALYNLANLKMRQGDAVASDPLYRRLLMVDPTFIGGWINLGMARSANGDPAEAELCLRHALALQPDHVGAHWNLANLLLAARRWPEAWAEYEWRLRRPECPPPPASVRDWTAEDRQARRILLWNDQGMGDALQFARYAAHLARRGHEVWLFVQDALKPLLRSVPGAAGVVGASDPVPPVDAQAPLLSLPHRLGMPDPQISWRGPYLRPQREMDLRRRAGHRAVGLVWASNPTHPNRALRDVPLAALAPLLDIKGIDWFGLQVGTAAHDIAAAGLADRIHDLSPRIHDFADTAAAVAALDLVISVDTSMPHLVGAMGAAGWVMISAAREWRWAGRETESLWYPTLRLFRQTAAGDWSPVVAALAAALRGENAPHA